MKRFSWIWLIVGVFCLCGTSLFAQESHEILFDSGVEATMRDGAVLQADVYRPKADGKYPVLLLRTPYDKQDERDIGIYFAQKGYVVVLQDVRGRYTSGGEWYPFKNESADGYDTVEWAAGLPYTNGKVGMFGGSYEAVTQMLAAIAHPPHLTGIFPVDTGSNYHDGWIYQGGAFEQWMTESWTSSLSRDTLDRKLRANNNPMEWIEKLPVASYPVQKPAQQEKLAPYFFDWLEHPSYDDFWKEWAISEHFGDMTVPAIHVGAWYDIFLNGTLQNYLGMKSGAKTEEARNGQWLIIGVGGHAGGGAKVGEVEFGKKSEINELGLMLRWYDFVLKSEGKGFAQEKRVKLFVMGKNEWRDEDEWPLARAKNTNYFLESAGKANSVNGDGRLELQPEKSETGKDSFEYDPEKPVPTHGGPLCCMKPFQPAGPLDQRVVEAREDVLVYSTEALTQDLEVTGPVEAELYVSSAAVDTDFTAKLVDVWPSGFAQNLCEGILRMRYRGSAEHPEAMEPGKIYKIKIAMTATSNVFLAGHKIRLEISSSNFPRFDRNLNTGEVQAHATRVLKTKNTVLHDKEHPSAVILPVVPRAS